MAIADDEQIDGGQAPETRTGLITQPQHDRSTPAMLAEQQRAKSEIEASLTIAAARPRDEAAALDAIVISCQRPGVAEKAQYCFSRGGTEIEGASIDLLELIAQKWGNIEYGFRELARFPGVGGQPGESIVEAFAWDLQSNSRCRRQFTVRHVRDTKGGGKALRDERDIYEMVANMAQRRVRTCLENSIPRDIVETAREECDRTLQAREKVTPEGIKAMLDCLATFGIAKAHVEARLQRNIDSITAAQMVQMRKIVRSLKDGMATADDFFDMQADSAKKPTSAMDAAKEKLRGKSPITKPSDASDPEPAPLDFESHLRAAEAAIAAATTMSQVADVVAVHGGTTDEGLNAAVRKLGDDRKEQLRGAAKQKELVK